MIDFKGSQYPKSVVVFAVTFYVRYAVSYRDLEEIMAERGVDVDHSASATPEGTLVAQMVRTGQIGSEDQSIFQVIANRAA